MYSVHTDMRSLNVMCKEWSIDSYGSGPKQIRKPLALQCLPDDSIIVADSFNYRLQTWDISGRSHNVHPVKDSTYGTQLNPAGMALTPHNELSVVDRDDRAVHVYKASLDSMQLQRSWFTGTVP